MADTSSDRTLVALLDQKEDELDHSPRSQSDADGRSSLPTLNERVEMYFRAIHGSEHVATADERAAAREQMLSAMAVDLADGTASRGPPLPDPQTPAPRLEPTRSSVR